MSPASDTPGPEPLLSFIAFDFGTKRIGLATGNTLTRSAQPLGTLRANATDDLFFALERLIAEWQPNALVVGVPFHPDGAPHENTARARRFAARLRTRYGRPVHEVDERYTTTEARSLGATDLDAASAAIILNQFLSELE